MHQDGRRFLIVESLRPKFARLPDFDRQPRGRIDGQTSIHHRPAKYRLQARKVAILDCFRASPSLEPKILESNDVLRGHATRGIVLEESNELRHRIAIALVGALLPTS